jgi:hypothetical protein
LAFLLSRQKEFREAALQAKRKGEVNQAKEYLRLAKGFDPLIEASNSGLPVDMDTVSSIQNFFLCGITDIYCFHPVFILFSLCFHHSHEFWPKYLYLTSKIVQ